MQRYSEIIPDFDCFREIQACSMISSARINTLKTDRKRILERLKENGIDYEAFSWYSLGLKLHLDKPGKLLEYLLGFIHIQEEVSMVPPLVLDPRPGEKILDLCASPGSKTTQISQMMENRGLVVANEPSMARIAALRSNCERLGVLNVAITRYDGRQFPEMDVDRILVDAPCSSEGRARRDPGIWNRCSGKRSQDLACLQKALLRRAVQLAKPGGSIVYSTCTYAPEENELVVESVLDQARVESFSLPGLRPCPGLTDWQGRPLSDELKHCARYYPHLNDTGGFFVARIIKE